MADLIRGVDPCSPQPGHVYQIRPRNFVSCGSGWYYRQQYDRGRWVWVRILPGVEPRRKGPNRFVFTTLRGEVSQVEDFRNVADLNIECLGPGGGPTLSNQLELNTSDLEVITPEAWMERRLHIEQIENICAGLAPRPRLSA